MPSDDATVADVLADVDGDTEYLRLVAESNDPKFIADMDYEDWVRPMKLTGGRVCLKVDHPATTRDVYWTVEGDVPRVAWSNGEEASGPGLVRYLRQYLRDVSNRITPVLREDTPFAEVDDDDK